MLAKGKGVHREVESEGSQRQKSAPTNRNYIRRIVVGDAAKQSKARYCTEQQNVNIEATWAESGYTYPERSGGDPTEVQTSTKVETDVRIKNNIRHHQKSAEVIVGRKRAAPSNKVMRKSHKRMKD